MSRPGFGSRVAAAVARALRGLATDPAERGTDLAVPVPSSAWTDALTGLGDRTLLRLRVEHALLRRERERTPVGLLLIDLDGFQAVNDTCGHAIGDALLAQLGSRLLREVRQGDTVARIGGDEFAVLLEDPGEGDLGVAALEVAERLLLALSQPTEIAGQQLQVTASMGLVLADRPSDAESLLRQAELALYAAKDAGPGRVRVFGSELAAAAARRRQLAQGLLPALDNGQLSLAYQAIVDVRTGAVVGAEALARWEHPEWGAISPVEFIPLAERTGVITQVGRWALARAAEQAASWQQQGLHLDVAVNVSVRQLCPSFVADVARVLAATELEAGRLTLEITESLLVDDAPTRASLSALRALGVRIALDDFGTGWSSLSYLCDLPVDVLKLDRSFVAGLGSRQANAVSRTVLLLAAELGLEVVAEGVETAEQHALLSQMGCPTAQGWLFSPAESPGALVARLNGAGLQTVPVPRGSDSERLAPHAESRRTNI
jgi:diguanylate cyclase (GGDEF)-like protein